MRGWFGGGGETKAKGRWCQEKEKGQKEQGGRLRFEQYSGDPEEKRASFGAEMNRNKSRNDAWKDWQWKEANPAAMRYLK